MPLMKSSSTGGNADRGFRKVKVVLGKSKGSSSSGDVMTLESKSRNDDRAHGKVKVDTRKSKGSSDGVRAIREDDKAHRRVKDFGKSKGSSDSGRTLKTKAKWSGKDQSSRNGNDALHYGNSVEKSSKSHSWRERDLKTKRVDKGFEAASDGNSGRKRKRISDNHGKVEDGLYDVRKLDRKAKFRVQKNVGGSYFNNGKHRLRGKSRELEDSGRYKSTTGSRKFRGTELHDKRTVRGKTEGTDKVKHVQESILVNGTLKTVRRKYPVDSAVEPHRNRFQSKKSLNADSEFLGCLPKKSKRVIRLDRNDISNKRLDDAISNNGNSQGDKDLEPSEGEISKNAQFRAIIPSSSILSFVEDNLLGRRREIEFRRAGYNIEFPSPLDNLPMSTSSERERIEVPVFRNKLEFFAAAKISSSFPAPDLPEIAFAGRSNVGKSSLLNSLTRQWGVVRTSDKPGLTQSINFFKLGPKLSLVDLPGYGFAYAKDEVKEAWEELVKEYVSTRVGLQRVCLLVDTKWGLKPRDHELIDLMERSQTKYQIVLTKTDMVFPVDVARRAMQIEENLKAKKSAVQPLMMVSSKTGAGIRSLRTALANIVRFARL